MLKLTSDIFKSYLQCKYKFFLKTSGHIGVKSDYENMMFERGSEFKTKAISKCFCIPGSKDATATLLNKYEKFSSEWCKILVKVEVDDGNICSHCDVLERVPGKSKLGNFHYIPVLLIESERFSKEDKISLGYNGLAIGNFQGRMPDFGKIIYSSRFLSTKVRMDKYIQSAREKIDEFKEFIDKNNQPRLLLNPHCRTCEFMNLCKNKAIEKDDLSLLGGMTEKEINKQNQKGIFTVTQYSYTFRPRKTRRLAAANNVPRMLELKALAVRTGKIYVYDRPNLTILDPQIYLDVEGDPEKGFNYLIGMMIVQNGIESKESFWADCFMDEDLIFAQFLKRLEQYSEFSLFHYGSYEIKFIKRMKNKIETVIGIYTKKLSKTR